MASLITSVPNATAFSGTPCDVHVRSIEIKFKDGRNKYPVSIKASFGENTTDKSRQYGTHESVHWPIEKRFTSGSQFIVHVREHHGLRRTTNVMTVPVSVSELIAKPFFEASSSVPSPVSLAIHCGPGGPFIEVIRRLIEQSEVRLGAMKGFLEKLGRACEVLDYIVTITEVVSSVHPAAESAASAATKLLEFCRKLRECHLSASELMEEVTAFLPFTDIPEKGLKCEVTARTTEEMLVLFESICKAIIKYSTGSILGGLLEDRIEEIHSFMEKFRKLKETFAWCLTTENWKTTLRIEENTDNLLLRHLHPVTEASYREDKVCFKGSRIDTLRAVETWSESNSSPPIFWLCGSPGLGKSTIAHTVAKQFRDQNRLAGYFFPLNEQNSHRIMPTIAYQMAKWHADYHANILDVLRGREELDLHSGLSSQFDLLMKRPISEMSMHLPPAHKPLIVVLDALENCNDSEDCRRPFVDYVVDIATLVPWLKVFVSSRELKHAETRFRRIQIRNLLLNDPVLDLHHDIAAYSRLCMECQDSPEAWVPGMKNGVQGLFRRISGSLIALNAVQSAETLDSTTDSWDIEQFFHVLIKSIMVREDFHNDDIPTVQQILAVTSCTTSIKPPTEEALFHILQPVRPRITPDHLHMVISRLSPLICTNNENTLKILFPHKVFSKFILKEYRAARSRSDVETMMWRLSLHMLHTELKFNICGLDTPRLANDCLPGLKDTLSSHISEIVRYCSLHWMDLVALSGNNRSCNEELLAFLCSPKVIFWIEVLALLGELDTGKSILSKCVDHFKDEDRIVNTTTDLLDFISEFEPAIALSTPHIYISILWLPSDWPIRNGMRPRVPKMVFESFPTSKPASDAVTIDSKTNILCIARSLNGDRIVSGSVFGTLGIWDGLTGARIGEEIRGHTSYVNDVRYSPDGSRFVSGSDDGTVKIWDVTGKLVTKMESDSQVRSVAFSADGVVARHGNGMLQIWNAENGNLIAESRGHEGDVRAVAYSPDGTRIVSGSWDNTVRIWDAQSGASIGEPLKGHEAYVFAVAYSPNGSRIVSGSKDATVRIWDAHTGNQIGEPLKAHEYAVVDVGYSQDGSRIMSASHDNTIRFWNATNGDLVGVLRRGESRWDPERQYFVSIPSWWPASKWNLFSIQSLAYSSNPLYIPDDGWIRTLDGGLLLWVPPQHRRCSCHASRNSTVTANDCDERLTTSAWKDIPQGANWAKMMNVEESD